MTAPETTEPTVCKARIPLPRKVVGWNHSRAVAIPRKGMFRNHSRAVVVTGRRVSWNHSRAVAVPRKGLGWNHSRAVVEGRCPGCGFVHRGQCMGTLLTAGR